jgi:hypothetical protein
MGCITARTETEGIDDRGCMGNLMTVDEGSPSYAKSRVPKTIYYHWLDRQGKTLYVMNLLTRDVSSKYIGGELDTTIHEGVRTFTDAQGCIFIFGAGEAEKECFQITIQENPEFLLFRRSTSSKSPMRKSNGPNQRRETASMHSQAQQVPLDFTINRLTDMLRGRSHFNVVSLPSGQAYLIGGVGMGGHSGREVELYDLVRPGNRRMMSQMTHARVHSSACALLSGDIIVAGGVNPDNGRPVANWEKYHRGSDSWTEFTVISPIDPYQSGLFQVDSKRLILFGGLKFPGKYASNENVGIDPNTGCLEKRLTDVPVASPFTEEILFFEREFYVMGELSVTQHSGRRFLAKYDIACNHWTIEWYEKGSEHTVFQIPILPSFGSLRSEL